MLTTKTIAAVFASFVVLISCKKDDEGQSETPPDPNAAYSATDFSLLTEGNYWVYERKTFDSTGVLVSGLFIDSVFFAGDTVINGEAYLIQRHGQAGGTGSNVLHYLRDSSDCLVDPYGDVIFRYGVFDQVAWTDTVPFTLYIDYTLSSSPSQQTVPAGTFTCYKWSGAVGMINTALLPVPPSRYPYYYWSPGVGMVKQMEPFVSSGWMMVHELLRYHVQ